MKTKYALGLVLAAGTLVSAALAGCGLVSAAKPVAVIASPPSGTQVDANSDVQVQVNASDSQGVVRIDLQVNGAVVTSESAPTPGGQPTFSAVLHWTPTTPGQQVVGVLAYNVKGDVSAPVAVNIIVRQALASATGTPASVPTSAASPTATAQPTDSSSASAATATPQPAVTVVIQAPPQPPQQPPSQPQPTQPAAPSKPSNFKPNGTGTTITFNWTDNSTNEVGFRIYQNGVTAPVVTVPAHTGTGGMSYDWTGRPCGFSATFSIRAYNDNGESGSSNSDTGVTVPCVPTSLIAQASGTSITFNWAVAAQHDEAGFRIYQQGVAQPVASRGPNLGSGGTNYFWSGMSCNLLGTYTVRAYNTAGESSDSNAIQTETIPCPPSGLTVSNVSKFDFDFSFVDNATNETGFHVYEDDKLYVPLAAHNGTGTVKTAFSQQCNQTHIWSLKAYNYAGESLTSEHVGVTTPSVCF